jgi:hypothetical protein
VTTRTIKVQENKRQSAANTVSDKQRDNEPAFQFGFSNCVIRIGVTQFLPTLKDETATTTTQEISSDRPYGSFYCIINQTA